MWHASKGFFLRGDSVAYIAAGRLDYASQPNIFKFKLLGKVKRFAQPIGYTMTVSVRKCS
jgi:hypothetical protein